MQACVINEVRIFELRFNYLYSNLDNGNLIFLCKSAEGVNSRCRRAAGSMSFKLVGRGRSGGYGSDYSVTG